MTGNALVPLILAHRERGRARIRAHSLIAVMRVTGIRTVAERHARHAVLLEDVLGPYPPRDRLAAIRGDRYLHEQTVVARQDVSMPCDPRHRVALLELKRTGKANARLGTV